MSAVLAQPDNLSLAEESELNESKNGSPQSSDVFDLDALLTRVRLAEELNRKGYPISPKTLATKASRGGGPPYVLFGRRPLYRWRDALSWAEGRLTAPRCSSSEGDAAARPIASEEGDLLTKASLARSEKLRARKEFAAKDKGKTNPPGIKAPEKKPARKRRQALAEHGHETKMTS